jgi:cytochrome oxidase Cu insertion factor (SCO1/SenC/PrrC family)
MKKIFFAMFGIIFSFSVYAQTGLTTAIDFTVTDTDSIEHNLFDYLDDGKYVVLDFFFTT